MFKQQADELMSRILNRWYPKEEMNIVDERAAKKNRFTLLNQKK